MTSATETRLLDKFTVGQTLGEGAFGVVKNCTEKATGKQCAVKMVDKVETPIDAIKKEAELLQQMDHKNIVKCHGVFYEKCFVCIVMDKYSGGDLVEGLQWHLKEKGQIPCEKIVHVMVQMAAGTQFLHSRGVVHRDIKGDNYLMDRQDMTHPDSVIVLTDFGTVCKIKEGERLSAGVGTKIFWSPEFFDKKYSLKVDVWAMGVIKYGLATGRFPFRDEKDVRTKVIKIPKRVPEKCIDLITVMLTKPEKDRPDADKVMQHPFLASQVRASGGVAEGGDASKDNPFYGIASKDETTPVEDTKSLTRDGANDGVKERREKLLGRLANKGKAGASEEITNIKASFFIKDDKTAAPGTKLRYEWWNEDKVNSAGLLSIKGQAKAAQAECCQEARDSNVFSKMLEEHHIDVTQFGKNEAKNVEQLAAEVRSGAARLMLDASEHRKLVRVVDIVVLRLRAGSEQKLLVETEECFPDGRKRETLRLPATKKEPHENAKQTAERIVEETMKLSSKAIQLNLTKVERNEEQTESPSYPGLATVYRKEILDCTLETEDTTQLEKAGLPSFVSWKSTDPAGNIKTWAWMTDGEAVGKKVQLHGEEKDAVSTLVQAPIGFDEEGLLKYLTGAGVDVNLFGKNNAKSIKEFSAELVKGEATLMTDQDGRLVRIVDVVLMIIKKVETNEFLVQVSQILPDKKTIDLSRLPGAKRRPDENQFLSARRVIRRQLEIDENAVKLSEHVEFVEEEKSSPSYPGLVTLYRKRLIHADVVNLPPPSGGKGSGWSDSCTLS